MLQSECLQPCMGGEAGYGQAGPLRFGAQFCYHKELGSNSSFAMSLML